MSLVQMKKSQSKSGISPAGDRVLVLPDPIKDNESTKIELPDWVKNKYEQAQATGTLVAVGPDAFSHVTERVYHIHGDDRKELVEERVRGYSEPFARVGDRIAFAQYTGLRVTGEDGESYLILNDEDITAKVSDAVEFTKLDTRKALGSQTSA